MIILYVVVVVVVVVLFLFYFLLLKKALSSTAGSPTEGALTTIFFFLVVQFLIHSKFLNNEIPKDMWARAPPSTEDTRISTPIAHTADKLGLNIITYKNGCVACLSLDCSSIWAVEC